MAGISVQGQLSFTSLEQLVHSYSAGSIVSTATLPAIDSPGDASFALLCNVSGTTGTGRSIQTITLEEALDEFWIEFDWKYVHPGAQPNNIQNRIRAIRLLNDADELVLKIVRVTDIDIETQVEIDGGTLQIDWSTDLAHDTWGKVKIRFKKETDPLVSADGIVETYLNGNLVCSNSALTGLTLTNVKKIELQCEPVNALGTLAGDKQCWYRNVAWGATSSKATFRFRNLRIEHCASDSDSTKIDCVLCADIDQFASNVFDIFASTPFVRFEYKKSSEGSWTTFADVSISNSDAGCLPRTVVTGLDPLTAYDFRYKLMHSTSTEVFTSEQAHHTTQSAPDGEPGVLLRGWSSCWHQGMDDGGDPVNATCPKTVICEHIRNNVTHGFTIIGDLWYSTLSLPDTYATVVNSPATTLTDFRVRARGNFTWDYDISELFANLSIVSIFDNEDSGITHPDGDDLIANFLTVNQNYVSDGRLPGKRIDGGRGWWDDSYATRRICVDCHSGRVSTGATEDITMLGDTQHEAVKDLLENSKPITYLITPKPCAEGWGTSNDADGWNQKAEYRVQLLDLIDHWRANNPPGYVLILLSGDRHIPFVATDDAWQGVQEWGASPLRTFMRDDTNLNGTGNTTVLYIEEDHIEDGPAHSRYGITEDDEANLLATLSLIDADTDTVLFTDDFQAEESESVGGGDEIVTQRVSRASGMGFD